MTRCPDDQMYNASVTPSAGCCHEPTRSVKRWRDRARKLPRRLAAAAMMRRRRGPVRVRAADDIADEGHAPAAERRRDLSACKIVCIWRSRPRRVGAGAYRMGARDLPAPITPTVGAIDSHRHRALDPHARSAAAVVRRSRQRVRSGYHDESLRLVGGRPRLLPSIGQPRRRLVLCIAGYRDRRSIDRRTPCARPPADQLLAGLRTRLARRAAVRPARGVLGNRRHEADGGRRDRRRLGRASSAAPRSRAICSARPLGLRRRPRPPARGAPVHLAGRHADPRARRTRPAVAVRSPSGPRRRRCQCFWRVALDAGAAVMARKPASTLVPRPAGRAAASDRGRLGFLQGRGRCRGEKTARTSPAANMRPAACRGLLARRARARVRRIAPSTPQARHLQPLIAAFDLPRQAFDDVIHGVAMDLDTARYQTFADLYEYCRRVASAVGLICIGSSAAGTTGPGITPSTSASPFSSRTSCATSPTTSREAACICRSKTLRT